MNKRKTIYPFVRSCLLAAPQSSLNVETDSTQIGKRSTCVREHHAHSRLFMRGTTPRSFFFSLFLATASLKVSTRVADHTARMKRWLLFFQGAQRCKLEYSEGNANKNVGFLSRLPLPAIESGRTGRSGLPLSDEERIFLVRRHISFSRRPSAMRVGLGGLKPPKPELWLGWAPVLPA